MTSKNCPLPLPSTLRFAPVYKLAKLVPRLLLLHPAGRGVKTHVILSKNCGEEEQSENFGEEFQNKINVNVSWLDKDRNLIPIPSPNERGSRKSAFTLAEVLQNAEL